MAQDEESVDLDVESGSQKSDTAAEDVMVDMDTFSEETDNEEQFQLKIMEDSESANTVSNVQSTFEEADVEQGSNGILCLYYYVLGSSSCCFQV